MFRVVPGRCHVVKPFVFNGALVATRGSEWFINGEPCFPDVPSVDGNYRTHFGPTFPHNGVIYSNSNYNQRLAFRRITAVREPESPGNHERLFQAQATFLAANGEFIEQLARHVARPLEQFNGNLTEALDHYADPHVKKALRIHAMSHLRYSEMINRRVWMKTARCFLKLDEIGKVLKYPRNLFSLGVEASLEGFRLAEYLKSAFARRDVQLNRGSVRFVKSNDYDLLVDAFRLLDAPPADFFMIVFSDDACLAVREAGVVKRYNLDISSCDSSHGAELFAALVTICGEHRDDAQALVDQCSAPIRIFDLSHPSRFLQLEPSRPMLYSGSTLTTVVNGLAQLFIAKAIDASDLTQDGIMLAARNVGYIVTLDFCPTMHHIQFLKYSPVRDAHGVWQPLLNLGVLLRTSGNCRGDLPGRGDLLQRALARQAGLLLSLYPHFRFSLIDALRSKARDVKPVTMAEDLRHHAVTPREMIHISDEEVCERYGGTQQYYALLELVLQAGPQIAIATPFTDAVYNKDYGLNASYTADEAPQIVT
jgi:hypothetical protein